MDETNRMRIDLAAVEHNLRLVRRIVGPEHAVGAVVKADAYGLGAVRVGRSLVAAGADLLAVYTPEQAAELATAGVTTPVLVLMPTPDAARDEALRRTLVGGRVHLTIHGLDHARELHALAERLGANLPVHVEIDTGMSRGGCGADEAGDVLRAVAGARRLRLAGVFTHYAASRDDAALTESQRAAFRSLLTRHASLLPAGCLVHAANTFATLRGRRFHESMVRVGLAWTGALPLEGVDGTLVPEAGEFRPAVSWSSRVVHLKWVEAGRGVGYGGLWRAPRLSRIALVPVGYADGYPRLGPGAAGDSTVHVAVCHMENGRVVRRFAPVVGAVNMDQITLDVTDLPTDAVTPGTRVELVSPVRNLPSSLDRLASAAGVTPYEILTAAGPRAERVYVREDVEEAAVAAPAPALAG